MWLVNVMHIQFEYPLSCH